MGAREKLNSVVVGGCLIVAALVGGLVMESWPAFFGILVVTIAACHHAEGIRVKPGTRRPNGGRGGRR